MGKGQTTIKDIWKYVGWLRLDGNKSVLDSMEIIVLGMALKEVF